MNFWKWHTKDEPLGALKYWRPVWGTTDYAAMLRQYYGHCRLQVIGPADLDGKITGKRAHTVIIDDPLNEEPMTDEIYNSTTHGPIKLSFSGRRLLQNLRIAITAAIARGAWDDPRHELSHARGELAQYISNLESVKAPKLTYLEEATANVIGQVRGLLGMPVCAGSVLEKVKELVERGSGHATGYSAGFEAAQRELIAERTRRVDSDERVAQAQVTLARASREAYTREAELRSMRASSEALRAELTAQRQMRADIYAKMPPPPIMMQMPREVTADQAQAVFDKIRAAVSDSPGTIGFTRTELTVILRDVLDGK